MERDETSVDISDMPDLARLADEVARTRRPCVLRRGEEEVAVVVPARRSPRQRRKTWLVDTSSLPSVDHLTLDDIVGMAGSLERPMEWKEMLEIAREDALREKYTRPS